MSSAVTIRQYRPADVPELVAAVHESVADLWPWMPWGTAAYSAADAEAWVRTTLDGHEAGSMYDFAVIDAAGRYVGGCGLKKVGAQRDAVLRKRLIVDGAPSDAVLYSMVRPDPGNPTESLVAEVHRALFTKTPAKRSLDELKGARTAYVRKRHSRG